MTFNYYESKKRVNNILNSKTEVFDLDYIPQNDSEFTYDNGIYAWVGALFVDIRNSTEYFKDLNKEHVARIMRAFFGEIISILNQNNKYVEIGIRGDCIYAIYSAEKKSILNDIFDDAILINTFQKMFQRILKQNNFKTFEIGIGLGASKDLIVKAGKRGTGINSYVWIGNAVIDASKLSSQGSKDYFGTIVMDSTFYANIKDFKANDRHNNSYYARSKYSYEIKDTVYCFDMIKIAFNDWIDNGMKDE